MPDRAGVPVRPPLWRGGGRRATRPRSMSTIRALLPLCLALCACGTTSVLEESRLHSRRNNHQLAYELLEQERQRMLAAGEQPTEAFERAYRQAEIDEALASAQADIFGEQEERALVALDRAEQLGADADDVARLRSRASYKLAVRAVQRGDECMTQGDLQEALRYYLQGLDRLPGFGPAAEGAEKVREAVARMTDRAQNQFLEAVRKLPEFRYVEVQWHAMNATTNDPTRTDAEAIRQRAQAEILQGMFARGRQLQESDQFGAALVEYRAIARIAPDYPGIGEAIAQMEREVEATRLVERAKMDMRMARFEQSRELLDAALQLSELSRAGIGELMMQSRRMEGEFRYQQARDLEILGKKEAALAAFEALAKDWPQGLRDEQARIDALRTDVEGAKSEWAAAEAAEAAGEFAAALEHYKAAARFHPEWKDVKERIARLEAKLRAGAEGGN